MNPLPNRVALALLLLVGGAACVNLGGVAPPAPTVWNAQLIPTQAYPGVSGQGAAISQAGGTTLGVEVHGGAPGAHYAWGLELGSCVTPGQQIGEDADYPSLNVDGTGDASGQAQFGSFLNVGSQYHIVVRLSASDTSRVACGNMTAQ